jgi:hypothetical protein
MANVAEKVRNAFSEDNGIQEGAPKEVPAEMVRLIEADEHRGDGPDAWDLHLYLLAYSAAFVLGRIADPFLPGFKLAEQARADATAAMVAYYGGKEVEANG